MANYTEHSIKTIEFGRACNERIGMYLSADLEKALNLGVRELIYNSMDELEMGFGDTIVVEINTKEQIIKVSDNARGIPVGTRADGTNSLTAALTIAHTGGKMDDEVYGGAVGLNGIGSKVVCHTAEWLKATVHTKGKIYFQSFHHTDEGAIADADVKEIGDSLKTGTIIEYKPSTKTYGTNIINIQELRETLQELSYFCQGKNFILNVDGKKELFCSKNGLADALATKKAVHKKPLHGKMEVNGVKVELALQWVKEKPNLMSFANNLYVPEGGAFMTGFKTAITKAFNSVMGTNYTGEMIRKYLDGFVSVKVSQPKFSNQAKTALANPEARAATSQATTEMVKVFLEDNKKDMANVIDLLDREQKAEDAAQRARDAVKQITVGGKKMKMIEHLPEKLAEAHGTGYRELFLAEGDSASGNMKSCRDPKTQAILSLRGKVLNTYSKDLASSLNNKEIKDILTTLGCGAGQNVNLKNLRYNKIIIATDADPDGHHIALLLMTLFLMHVRPLVEGGYVYKSIAPLYLVKTSKSDAGTYLYTDEEYKAFMKKHPNGAVSRFKGLGSMDVEETEYTLMREETRRLEQLTSDDIIATIKLYDTLMGKAIEDRKALAMAGKEDINEY